MFDFWKRTWIKLSLGYGEGHSGDLCNDKADEYANKGREQSMGNPGQVQELTLECSKCRLTELLLSTENGHIGEVCSDALGGAPKTAKKKKRGNFF